jgi:hypothetical protein
MRGGTVAQRRARFVCSLALGAAIAPACLITTNLDGLTEPSRRGDGGDGDGGGGGGDGDVTPLDAMQVLEPCAAGLVRCGDAGACVDVDGGDKSNCGACGMVCPNRCAAGLCHVCVSQGEHGVAHLACPPGTVVREFVFESYGQPRGTCGAFTKAVCDAPMTANAVEGLCQDQPSCDIAVENGTFGPDPCVGTSKTLDVEVVCAP